MGRDDCAGVGLCSKAAWRVVWDDGAQIFGDSDDQYRETPFFREGLGCDTWPHAVEMPIRLGCDTWPHAVEMPIRLNPPT